MKLLVLSGPEAQGLLPLGACADAMLDAALARRKAQELGAGSWVEF